MSTSMKSCLQAFRVQACHVLGDLYGRGPDPHSRRSSWFRKIHDTLCREYGVFTLPANVTDDGPEARVFEFFMNASDIAQAIDVLQVAVSCSRDAHEADYVLKQTTRPSMSPDE